MYVEHVLSWGWEAFSRDYMSERGTSKNRPHIANLVLAGDKGK